MTGKEEYEYKIQRKINNLLEKNERYLIGYYSFIGINKSLSSRYEYLLAVLRFVEKTSKPINKLEMDDFTVYITEISTTKSSSYAITNYAALKLFGKYLYASHNLSYNPMEYVERPKYKETIEMQEKREMGFLDSKEIKQVKINILQGVGKEHVKGKQTCFKERDMLILLILLSTGMRCSALIKLDVDDIDLSTNQVVVYDKGNKINTYKLPQETIEYYKKWIKIRSEIFKNLNHNALFVSKHRTRMSQKTIADIINKYTANIEGKHITPHKLRATFGTQVYNATHDIYFTQQCMHHNSPKTTELYVRGQTTNTDKVADIMSKILK